MLFFRVGLTNFIDHGVCTLKTFILDTNVLLHNSSAIFMFGNNKVVIPLPVIEELDKFKSFSDEKGRHAREVARQVDRLRSKGKLYEGVNLDNGGILQVISADNLDIPCSLSIDKPDNQMLAIALAEQRKTVGAYVCFVTKDLNARIKADALGIPSEDFETDKVNVDELYRGWRILTIPAPLIASFRENRGIDRKELESYVGTDATPFYDNQFVEFIKEGGAGSSKTESQLLGKYVKDLDRVIPLRSISEPWGIGALNEQQRYALDLLLDESIHLVTLVGKAGTGKTLLAIAAGLQATIDERTYRRILVSRPIMPMGNDIGFLPGSKDDKLGHWMQPIFDNLEFIFNRHLDAEVDAEEQLLYLLKSKKIELEALTYIRGRSIPKQYLIVDEAQNLTPHEVKTIISRAGEGTKVVLTGDPYQIDNPYLDASSNGLTTVVERFKGQRISGHITLEKSERSQLSSLAVNLL